MQSSWTAPRASDEKTMAENPAAARVAQQKDALNKDFKQLKPLGLGGESDGDEPQGRLLIASALSTARCTRSWASRRGRR